MARQASFVSTPCPCDVCDDEAVDGGYCRLCRARCAPIVAAVTGQTTRALGTLARWAWHRDARRAAEARELDVPWALVARTLARRDRAAVSTPVAPAVPALELEPEPGALPRYACPLSPEDRARAARYLTILTWKEDRLTGHRTPIYLGSQADALPSGGPVADLPTCTACGGIAARCPCPCGTPIINTFARWPAPQPVRAVPPTLRDDALAAWWRGVVGRPHEETMPPPEPIAPPRRTPAAKVTTAAVHDLLLCDVETTGLSPAKHHLIEVAVARLTPDASACRARYASRILLPPRAEVEARALEVNGYDPLGREWQRTAKPLREVMARVKELAVGKPILVAHNVRFDRDFLRAGFALAGIPAPALGGTLCTKALAASLAAAAHLPGTKLDQIAVHFGAVGKAHTAAGDVCRLLQVLWCLKQLEREHAGRQAAMFG